MERWSQATVHPGDLPPTPLWETKGAFTLWSTVTWEAAVNVGHVSGLLLLCLLPLPGCGAHTHTHTHKASWVLSVLLWLHPLCTFSLNHASFSASLKCQLSHLKSYAEPLERVLLLSHLKARTGPALCCACMPPRRLQPLRLQRPVKEVGACWTCCAADRHAEAPLPCHGLESVEWHEWKEAVFRRWRVQTGGVRHANNSGPQWLTTPTGTDITLLLQCQILLHWMSDVKSNAPKNRIG